MKDSFDYFVVFAEMRTGSNFLEANLNEFDGLTCHGEVFNPAFIGHDGCQSLFGMDIAQRDSSPAAILETMRAGTVGMAGFRFFNNHDPRILELAVSDRRAAKIILTRNPLDSYVSWKIARATGQWRLGKTASAKTVQIDFDTHEFREHLGRLGEFQRSLNRKLQRSGQTAFRLSYDDISTVGVLNGLATWLGIEHRIEKLSDRTMVQNPIPLASKVRNFDQMVSAISELDLLSLFKEPVYEPRRGGGIPGYLAAADQPILFMSMPGGPTEPVATWLHDIGGGAPISGFNQKMLRRWMRQHPGHRSFTILSHPLTRAYRAFCSRILPVRKGSFHAIRKVLQQRYGMHVPNETPGPDWTATQQQQAFLAFLGFIKRNLSGQTSVRVDGCWASQSELIRGMGEFAFPDIILRENQAKISLDRLAEDLGQSPADWHPAEADQPFELADIYSGAVEQACRDAYPRDYLLFGWTDWSAPDTSSKQG